MRRSIVRRKPVLEILEPRTLLAAMVTPLDVPEPSDAQWVFLDADGARGVEYRGPVSIPDIDVPAFSAERFGLAGRERAVLERTRDLLNAHLGPDVRVTLDPPAFGADHSTIHIGGDDARFESYGSFVGLAEQVDRGNLDRQDLGFVFTDEFLPSSTDAETLAVMLATVAGHEIGHLMGDGHTVHHDPPGPLDHVAFAQDVHQWLTMQGYLLFTNQFGSNVVGQADYLNWFVLGSHDGDEPDLNPFDNGSGLDHPSLRHFWSHDNQYARTYDNGLLGYDSAANRAMKFITGGIDYASDVDGDWGKGPSRPGGTVAQVGQGAAALLSTDPITAFYYLGQAAHLLQDMAVPAHVHSDPHLEGWGFLDDPDPFHDWVDGVEFSQSGAGNLPKAHFDAPAAERYREWALVNESGQLLRDEDSSTLRSPWDIDPSFASGASSPSIEALYRLFLDTAGIIDDFDSRDAEGQVDGGDRGNSSYASWTSAKLNEVADEGVPIAIRNVAEIMRYLYGVADEQDPSVEFRTLNSHDPGAPEIVYHSTVPLEVAASDEATGNSGVGKDLFEFEYQELAPGGTWSEWKTLPPATTQATHVDDLSPHVAAGSSLAGKQGAWTAPLFRGMFDYTYGFRVTVEDGGGRTTTSDASYVRVERPGISVVSVIDRSASMLVSITDPTPTTCPSSESPNSRLQAAKEASSVFVSLMNPRDKIGVAAFSGTATVEYALAEIQRNGAERIAARQAINSLASICAGTSIGAGIQAGAGELNRFPLDDVRAMVVLTDGDNNTYPDPITAVNATPSDIVVYTIGLGADVNEQVLTQTAELRNGRYFSAGSAAELRKIYAELTGLIGGEQIIQSRSGFIIPGQSHQSSFSVDPSMSTVTIGSEWGGSDLDLELVAPDGTVIDHAAVANDPSMQLIEGPNYEYVTIAAPIWGEWDIRVKAIDVPQQGEPYEVFVRTDSTIHTAVTHDPLSSLGHAGRVQVQLDDGAPILNAEVVAEVTRPVFSHRHSTDVPKNIPDVSTIVSTIDVDDDFMVTDVNLHIDVTHPWIFDLTAYLVAPNGVTVELFNEPNTGANLSGTILDDEAIHGFLFNDAPYTGRFRPSGKLSGFDGVDAQGTWSLVVLDTQEFDTGRLDQWSLEFEGIPSNPGKTLFGLLHDDGAHGDGSAGDGIYANNFLLGPDVGAHRIDVNINGTANLGFPFERSQTVVRHMSPSMRASTDVPRGIPDSGTMSSSVQVSDALVIGDVDVHLDITHPYVWDLDVFLVGPDGTRVELFTDVGGGGDNFTGTILDDEAEGDIDDLLRTVAPFTGRHRPEGQLSDFDGRGAQGTWRLEITDDLGGRTGTLNRWGLSFVPTTTTAPSFSVLLDDAVVSPSAPIDFGTAENRGALSRSINIRNDDNKPLALGPIQLNGGFVAEQSAVGQISPGQTATYVLRMNDAACGRRSGRMTVEVAREHESPISLELNLKGVVGLWDDCPWMNQVDPLDVNGDGQITPLDVLFIINSLNLTGSRALPKPPTSRQSPPPYFDTSGDNQMTPLDALLVINFLNNRGGGEGERTSVFVPRTSVFDVASEWWWSDWFDDDDDRRE